MSTMSVQQQQHHHDLVVTVRKWWRVILVCTLLVIAFVSGQTITYWANIKFQEAKTVRVFSEMLSLSETPVMLLDSKGVILKSNTWADKMFAAGVDIEGRNIHEFCGDPDAAKRGIEGMQRWYNSVPVGARAALVVSAKLAAGNQDIVILANAVPKTPGNDTAVTAIVNYANQMTFKDVRKP